MEKLLQTASDGRCSDVEILAHLLQTELDQRALSLEEKSLLLHLIRVLHAIVEFHKQSRKQCLKLLVGSTWLRETPFLLLLHEEVAYLVVVMAYFLEVALGKAAAILFNPHGLPADGLGSVSQDLALHSLGLLGGTCEHVLGNLMDRRANVALGYTVRHGCTLLLVSLSYLLEGQLHVVSLDLNTVEVLEARELRDDGLHSLLLVEGHVERD